MATITETTTHESSLEDEVSQIAQRFFDTIDNSGATEGGAVFIAHFVRDVEYHLAQEQELIDGVRELCAIPESRCNASNDLDSVEILVSRDSGNRLMVSRHVDSDGETYATTYWVVGKNQAPPY